MNFKNQQTDSGSYVNGVYTTKNGFSGSGLNCPKGGRLYDTSVVRPIFFEPEDTPEGEQFQKITDEVCPEIMPYYAVSNYGRVMNIYSGKVMKPNYRPNGYEYYCFASKGEHQKKFNTNRIVMKTFDPRPNMDDLQVNHINGDKSQNYYKKVMEDGSVESNLEWMTPSENVKHSRNTQLNIGSVLNMSIAKHIRELKMQGYSYNRIHNEFYPNVSVISIQLVCKNRSYYDPNYRPSEDFTKTSYTNIDNNYLKVSDERAKIIRKLAEQGYSYRDIHKLFTPDISVSTISDIVRGITHNREV